MEEIAGFIKRLYHFEFTIHIMRDSVVENAEQCALLNESLMTF